MGKDQGASSAQRSRSRDQGLQGQVKAIQHGNSCVLDSRGQAMIKAGRDQLYQLRLVTRSRMLS